MIEKVQIAVHFYAFITKALEDSLKKFNQSSIESYTREYIATIIGYCYFMIEEFRQEIL